MNKIMVMVLILGVGISVLGSKDMVAYAKDRYAELQNFTKVLNLVQEFYVEKVDTRKLIYGGIKGMLEQLDPHTNFMPAEIFKEFENETNGEFGGIGIEISVQKEILTVISPIEDTPAWEAGIKPGDRIVSINGTSTKGLSLVESAQLMRGKNGSVVELQIVREAVEKPLEFKIKRGRVKIRSVKYTDLGDGFGYFRLTSFIENTSDDLKKALAGHTKKYKDPKGIIIDLRRNPGGLLDQAVTISDMFLEKGDIVSTRGRNQGEASVMKAKKQGDEGHYPIIVLINEYSASASEILAGALRDNKRALIMGKRSFGKGSVQSVIKLGDGSGLKLTVARYYTPSGVSIQADGIKPDVEVDEVDPEAFRKAIIKKEARREADIEGHLIGENEKDGKSLQDKNAEWWKYMDKDESKRSSKEKLLASDYQAFQAYNYLKAWKVMNNLRE